MISQRIAAEVTPDRLVNAEKEPGNWLMNHRTYDAQRFSPLDKIEEANVKSLKFAYAVALGGKASDENLEATPLAEDGFSPSRGNRRIRQPASRTIGALL
jgi:alcohol dehydrogenase (cytochrome c)